MRKDDYTDYEKMITRINPCNPFTIRAINAARAQRRGYAIIEYLLVAAAALGAIMAVRTAVASKAFEVSNNEISKVENIPWGDY